MSIYFRGVKTIKDSRTILNAWIEGINSKRLGDVERLYNRNALVLPTFSSQCLDSPECIAKYFNRLASHEHLKVSVHDKTVKLDNLGQEIQVISGIYFWEIDIEGEILNFEARFTFVLDMKLESPIIHHHSSQVPRML